MPIGYNKTINGKYKLSVKYSYLAIIYQAYNNNNTFNVLFTPCALNIFFFGLNKKLFYLTHKFGNTTTSRPCILKKNHLIMSRNNMKTICAHQFSTNCFLVFKKKIMYKKPHEKITIGYS
jgi:hypothetical protein